MHYPGTHPLTWESRFTVTRSSSPGLGAAATCCTRVLSPAACLAGLSKQ